MKKSKSRARANKSKLKKSKNEPPNSGNKDKASSNFTEAQPKQNKEASSQFTEAQLEQNKKDAAEALKDTESRLSRLYHQATLGDFVTLAVTDKAQEVLEPDKYSLRTAISTRLPPSRDPSPVRYASSSQRASSMGQPAALASDTLTTGSADTLASPPKGMGPCAVCSKPGKCHCGGCSSKIDNQPRAYCSKACHASDWPAHKDECKARKAWKDRRMMIEACEFIKQAYLAYRRVMFDRQVDTVLVSPFMVGGPHRIFFRSTYKKYFTVDMTLLESQSKAVQEAILTSGQAQETTCFAEIILPWLFATTSIKVDEIDFETDVEPLATFHMFNGIFQPLRQKHLAVRLRIGKEKYVVDLTSAQYGFVTESEPLHELSDYLFTRNATNVKYYRFGSCMDTMMETAAGLPKGSVKMMGAFPGKNFKFTTMPEVYVEGIFKWLDIQKMEPTDLLWLENDAKTKVWNDAITAGTSHVGEMAVDGKIEHTSFGSKLPGDKDSFGVSENAWKEMDAELKEKGIYYNRGMPEPYH